MFVRDLTCALWLRRKVRSVTAITGPDVPAVGAVVVVAAAAAAEVVVVWNVAVAVIWVPTATAPFPLLQHFPADGVVVETGSGGGSIYGMNLQAEWRATLSAAIGAAFLCTRGIRGKR
jgi:hypothetical protein